MRYQASTNGRCAEVVNTLAIPDFRQRLIDTGSEIIGDSIDAADRRLRSEVERWAVVVRAAKIRAE